MRVIFNIGKILTEVSPNENDPCALPEIKVHIEEVSQEVDISVQEIPELTKHMIAYSGEVSKLVKVLREELTNIALDMRYIMDSDLEKVELLRQNRKIAVHFEEEDLIF